MWGAALAIAGSSVLGGIMQEKAQKKADAANQAAIKQGMGFIDQGVSQAEGANAKALQAAKQGFADATKSVGILGQGARRRLLRREKQRLGASDAEAANRGLYASTGAMGARRAIQADTDLSLSAVDEALAQIHSGLYRDRGMALSSVHLARQNLYGAAAAAKANLATSIIHQAAPIGAALGQAGGSLAQLLMMYGSSNGGGSSKFSGASEGVF